MSTGPKLRKFYYFKKLQRSRRTLELRTRKTKDRMASKERRFVKGKGNNIPVMAIGDQGTGVGSIIRGYDRRGGKWLKNIQTDT